MIPPDNILDFPLPPLPIAQPIRARFIPKEDITAYEVAILLPFYLGLRPLFEHNWIELGVMTRHLERIVEGPQVTV